jgi:hypothetical protein
MFATGNLKLRKKHINQPLGLDINICRLQIFTYFWFNPLVPGERAPVIQSSAAMSLGTQIFPLIIYRL